MVLDYVLCALFSTKKRLFATFVITSVSHVIQNAANNLLLSSVLLVQAAGVSSGYAAKTILEDAFEYVVQQSLSTAAW